jgi:histidine triad (HIT) family protein
MNYVLTSDPLYVWKEKGRKREDLPPGLIPNDPDCVFCQKILNQECEIAGPGAVAFEPLNPVVFGHVLVIPIVHATSARAAPRMAGTVMTAAVDYANKKNYPDCNFITSSGVDATQTVMHYHMHIVPRHENDGLHLPWTGQVT